MTLEQVEQSISLFQEMVDCSYRLSLWCYDSDCSLLYSNCPQEAFFASAFFSFGCLDYLKQYSKEHSEPLSLTTPIDMGWLAVFYKEGGVVRRIYTLGPFFSTEVSFDGINQVLKNYNKVDFSVSWQLELIRAMKTIPVVLPLASSRLILMFHYCVTGEKLLSSDIRSQDNGEPALPFRHSNQNRNHTWAAEQNLLRMIREGDLNYKDALSHCSSLSSGVPIHAKDPTRYAKDSVITSIVLASRAAIEGGLAPEIGYSVGDSYIQSVEDCNTASEAGAIHSIMLEDFINRVRKAKRRANLSKQIIDCCDYIDTHAEEELSIESLAKMSGYTEYYLSRKFKSEMGVSVGDYIKTARVERAKFLLTSTDSNIRQIAERLHFCSHSHFGQTFHKVTGCTPAEYREQAGGKA